MRPAGAAGAFKTSRHNPFSDWHRGPSGEVSPNAAHASRRIFEGLAQVQPRLPAQKLAADAPVFAMGSCFAREIEAAMIKAGGNVVSMDGAMLDRPEFRDAAGNVRTGFFHRFTPRAMWHEFKIAFDEMPGWDPASSLLFRHRDGMADFNYFDVDGFDPSADATAVRRAVGRELVRRVTSSSLVILTLGLTESWRHRPSGFYINRITPPVVQARADEFEWESLDYEDTLFCLRDIYATLKRHHGTGAFQLVVTVSPVPLQKTFSGNDVIVANEQSKAVLRAAAARFCAEHPEARYFPSFEMVRLSDPALAWRPDRLHVARDMVRHIARTFMDAYFETPPSPASP